MKRCFSMSKPFITCLAITGSLHPTLSHNIYFNNVSPSMTSIFNHPWFSNLFADTDIQTLCRQRFRACIIVSLKLLWYKRFDKHGLVASGLGQKAASQIMYVHRWTTRN